jgi:hypothetical protein
MKYLLTVLVFGVCLMGCTITPHPSNSDLIDTLTQTINKRLTFDSLREIYLRAKEKSSEDYISYQKGNIPFAVVAVDTARMDDAFKIYIDYYSKNYKK